MATARVGAATAAARAVAAKVETLAEGWAAVAMEMAAAGSAAVVTAAVVTAGGLLQLYCSEAGSRFCRGNCYPDENRNEDDGRQRAWPIRSSTSSRAIPTCSLTF